MKKRLLLLLILPYLVCAIKQEPMGAIIEKHLNQYGKEEFFTAVQVSIQTKGQLKTFVAGKESHAANSRPITATNLFNLGSITKSFTAALALLAESEGKINLNKNLEHYLSDYPHWGSLSLISLLNMSSGLPNYSDSPTINYLMSTDLTRSWSQSELIALVYKKELTPPLKSGYFYSNTGYILMDMILSAQYKTSFAHLLHEKILKPLALNNTYYPIPNYPTDISARMVRGYSYNVYENPELLGRDVTDNNLSWAGAAGALVGNSEDLIHWVEHLFIDDYLLSSKQKKRMQTLISLSSGQPLTEAKENDPRGFGLGIVQAYDAELGQYWFYVGETLGYRAAYLYVPCNQVIISTLFNSATNNENSHIFELVKALYKQLLNEDKHLNCQGNTFNTKSA